MEQCPKARSVLLPVNQTSHSKRALEWYANNLYQPQDFIRIIYILEPSYAATNFGLTAFGQVKTGEIGSMLQEHLELSDTLGHEFLTKIQERDLQGNFTLCVSTKPGEQIVAFAKDMNVDLIVMGSRGISTIRRTVFGSVSDYVLHHIDIPLTVVPPRKNASGFHRASIR